MHFLNVYCSPYDKCKCMTFLHLQSASSVSWTTYSSGMAPLESTSNRGADRGKKDNLVTARNAHCAVRRPGMTSEPQVNDVVAALLSQVHTTIRIPCCIFPTSEDMLLVAHNSTISVFSLPSAANWPCATAYPIVLCTLGRHK